MKTLEKEISKLTSFDITEIDLLKIKQAKQNYKVSGKSYSVEEAYNLGLSKLEF